MLLSIKSASGETRQVDLRPGDSLAVATGDQIEILDIPQNRVVMVRDGDDVIVYQETGDAVRLAEFAGHMMRGDEVSLGFAPPEPSTQAPAQAARTVIAELNELLEVLVPPGVPLVKLIHADGGVELIVAENGTRIEIEAGDRVDLLNLLYEQAQIEVDGDDVVIVLSDGSRLVLAGFSAAIDAGAHLVFAGGDDQIASFEDLLDATAPAAGTLISPTLTTYTFSFGTGSDGSVESPIIIGRTTTTSSTGVVTETTTFSDFTTETVVTGTNANDTLSGGNGPDTLIGGLGNDRLYGNGGHDSLLGGDGYDYLYGGSGDDTLRGEAQNDVLYGQSGRDWLDGGDGTDFLDGGSGADTLIGGLGTDYVSYLSAFSGVTANLSNRFLNTGDAAGDVYSSIERIRGSNYSDKLTGNSAANGLYGYNGNDTLDGGAGNDYLYGYGGNDLFIGGAGGDYMNGSSGADTASYVGSSAAVSVNLSTNSGVGGDAEGDRLYYIENLIGSAHDDSLTGDALSNLLRGGGGADTLDGGEGVDTASYVGSSEGVRIFLGSTSSAFGGDAEGDQLISIENVIGSSFDDRLRGDSANNELSGGDGDDFLEGREGDDSLIGGAGNDTLVGRSGADQLDGGDGADVAQYFFSPSGVNVSLATGVGTGGDAEGDSLIGIENLTGSGHGDSLTGDSGANVLEGGGGADMLDGGDGVDTASYASSSSFFGTGIVANLASPGQNSGDAQGDTYVSIENLTGSSRDDSLFGDGAWNDLSGLAGDDLLVGRDGADNLSGGDGDDTLDGGSGGSLTFFGTTSYFGDTLDGGAGRDWAIYQYSSFSVTVNLATGSATGGDAHLDALSGIENLIGSNYADSLTGDGGANALRGGYGNDTLVGGGGDDTLEGEFGFDILSGGAGMDTASYAHSFSGIVASLQLQSANTGYAQGDIYDSIENLEGTPYNDTLVGNNINNVLTGGAGADGLYGGSGGFDTASYADSNTGVDVYLTYTSFSIVFGHTVTIYGAGTGGHAEGDELYNIDGLIGSSFDDTLTGNSANNSLIGGDGSDLLQGGSGMDTLVGGAGADILTGGGGSDRFVMQGEDLGTGVDTLSDFQAGAGAGGDVLDIADILSDFGTDGTGIDANNIDSFLQLIDDGNTTEVHVDADGAGDAATAVHIATFNASGLVTATLLEDGNIDVT